MKRLFALLLALPLMLALPAVGALADKGDVARMTKEELAKRIDDADIVIIDTRRKGDWTSSQGMIKGAVREDPNNVQAWASKYDKEATIVLYCS